MEHRAVLTSPQKRHEKPGLPRKWCIWSMLSAPKHHEQPLLHLPCYLIVKVHRAVLTSTQKRHEKPGLPRKWCIWSMLSAPKHHKQPLLHLPCYLVVKVHRAILTSPQKRHENQWFAPQVVFWCVLSAPKHHKKNFSTLDLLFGNYLVATIPASSIYFDNPAKGPCRTSHSCHCEAPHLFFSAMAIFVLAGGLLQSPWNAPLQGQILLTDIYSTLANHAINVSLTVCKSLSLSNFTS